MYLCRKTEKLRKTVSIVALAVAFGFGQPGRATEPIEEVQIRATVEEVTPDSPERGRSATAVARIRVEIVLSEPVSDLEARIVKVSEGPSGRVALKGVRWSTSDGLPSSDLLGGQPSAAAGTAFTGFVDVPIAGRGFHGLALEVSGNGARGPVRNEAFVRVPLGVKSERGSDDGESVLFPLQVEP